MDASAKSKYFKNVKNTIVLVFILLLTAFIYQKLRIMSRLNSDILVLTKQNEQLNSKMGSLYTRLQEADFKEAQTVKRLEKLIGNRRINLEGLDQAIFKTILDEAFERNLGQLKDCRTI